MNSPFLFLYLYKNNYLHNICYSNTFNSFDLKKIQKQLNKKIKTCFDYFSNFYSVNKDYGIINLKKICKELIMINL